jgi:hypothetical protein
MPIVDLYSNRNAADHTVDVWIYDSIPAPLLVQVSNLVRDGLGSTEPYGTKNARGIYEYIRNTVTHEHGLDYLVEYEDHEWDEVLKYIRRGANIDVWLDVVLLSFRAIEKVRGRLSDAELVGVGVKIRPRDAVEELNERFRRAGFGYRYEDGKIFRIDNELLHQEATLPALRFLKDPRFAGANEEFHAAHAHFKAGEFKDCAVDANNALESTMKAICEIKGWSFSKGATAGDLLNVLRNNGFLPGYTSGSFQQLVVTLSSGLPALRNNVGGHGQGAEPVEVPMHVAAYAMHLAASKILFLFEAFRATENS